MVLEIVYVEDGYVCPICRLSTCPMHPDRRQCEFGVCQSILPVPICEVCNLALPYELTMSAEAAFYPRAAALMRLADLRGVADERILMIDYIEKKLASMCRSIDFESYLAVRQGVSRRAQDRPGRVRPTRRLAKKEWKTQIDGLQNTLTSLRAMLPTPNPADVRH